MARALAALALAALALAALTAAQPPSEHAYGRSRVLRCGEALRRTMAPDWGANATDVLARLGDPLGITTPLPAGDVLYTVALLRSSQSRVAWISELRKTHPKLVVLNATDRAHPEGALAHYQALGLKARFRLAPGQTGLWITELRFLAWLLLSGKEFGVLLEDDAAPPDDYEETLEKVLAGMPVENRFAAYRLGRYTTGMLYPREAAARLLGLACAADDISLPIDHFTVNKNGPHGCRIAYHGPPFWGMVGNHEIAKASNLRSDPQEIMARFEAAFHRPTNDRPKSTGLCGVAYPGRVPDPRQLTTDLEAHVAGTLLGEHPPPRAATRPQQVPPAAQVQTLEQPQLPAPAAQSAPWSKPPAHPRLELPKPGTDPDAPVLPGGATPNPTWPFDYRRLSGLSNRLILVPEHKLLFCYIEKVSCSAFNQLFSSIRSKYDPGQSLDKHPRGWTGWAMNSPAKLGYGSATKILQLLQDPTWHKAVFYREPLERFVSALQSKCQVGGHRGDGDGPSHCEFMFGKPKLTFEEAVNFLAREDNATDTALQRTSEDVHFRRQSQFCGGLSHSLRYYDTVEQLDRATSREKVIRMLSRVNISHEKVPRFDELFPVHVKNGQHNTDAGSSTRAFFAADATGRATRVIVDHYLVDYLTFGIRPPAWVVDDVNNRKAAMRLGRRRRG